MNEEELIAKREQFNRVSDYLYDRSEGKFFEIVLKLDCVFDEEFEFRVTGPLVHMGVINAITHYLTNCSLMALMSSTGSRLNCFSSLK